MRAVARCRPHRERKAMSDTLLALVAHDAREAIERSAKEGGDFQAQALAAFSKVKGHWMVTDEDSQFKGAVAALYQVADEDQKEAIKRELDLLKALSAAMNGVPVDFEAMLPVDFEAMLPNPDEPKVEPIGLQKLWREAVEA